MKTKTTIVEAKAESNNGYISGYAATWTRTPDSYGDVIARGAFSESIKKINAEHITIPFLWDHESNDLDAFIGIVTMLKEDSHGLYFEAKFNDTPKAQRARELALNGSLAKFSFAYGIKDSGKVKLEDGTFANELRELEIYEVSLVMYPANPDTGVVEVKFNQAERQRVKYLLRKAEELLPRGQAIKLIEEAEHILSKLRSYELLDDADILEAKADVNKLLDQAAELLPIKKTADVIKAANNLLAGYKNKF